MAYTTINKSTDYFNTKLYSGTGSSQNITGVGFQPDFTWIKSRSTSHEHKLIDVVRGVTKAVASDNTTQEFTDVQGLTAFGSDGYTIGTDSYYNTNGHNYASWNWKAGNSQGSSNTAGSINTAYTSVNTTAGFSISTYTGTGATATIGHGLGVAPAMIITKATSFAEDWLVYHKSMGNTDAINLNLTNAKSSSVNYWQNTTPSSSVFYVGANDKCNKSGATYVAYCFAEKTGYSKFGSYVGNGNADGTFVYTGFKPAFVLTKYSTSTSGWWQILDNKRDVYNPNSHALFANVADSEYNLSNYHTDYLSNGFKLRNSQAGGNTSGGTYIYMAFAEAPLVGSNNIPCTAR